MGMIMKAIIKTLYLSVCEKNDIYFFPCRFQIKPECQTVNFIPANLSPFGEIHRFEIKIGHPRESCRSEGFFFWARGGSTGRPAFLRLE